MMACPICDHTAEQLGEFRDRRLFWCPRCGTLIERRQGHHDETDHPLWQMPLSRSQIKALVSRHVDLVVAMREAAERFLHGKGCSDAE